MSAEAVLEPVDELAKAAGVDAATALMYLDMLLIAMHACAAAGPDEVVVVSADAGEFRANSRQPDSFRSWLAADAVPFEGWRQREVRRAVRRHFALPSSFSPASDSHRWVLLAMHDGALMMRSNAVLIANLEVGADPRGKENAISKRLREACS